MGLKHSDYVLGHNDREQLRLIRQARILAPLTENFLRTAGIVSGMRVLDIGCGMGDVTMLAAQLVGWTDLSLRMMAPQCATGANISRGSQQHAQRPANCCGRPKVKRTLVRKFRLVLGTKLQLRTQ